MSEESEEILKDFTNEVLKQGPQSCLPKNLSDEWLYILEDILENEEFYSIFLTIMLQISFAKTGSEKIELSTDEIEEYLRLYQTEIALEKVHRTSQFKYEPATLDTIFTNRNIKIQNEGEPIEET